MRRDRITFEFVEFIPKEEELEEGTVYVSVTYSTAVHKCCCGCGSKVVTPISPTDWTLIFDRDTISLDPSIGSWSLPCQSHYWIRRNRVEWAPRWTSKQIKAGRTQDKRAKEAYFKSELAGEKETNVTESDQTAWQELKRWWSKKKM